MQRLLGLMLILFLAACDKAEIELVDDLIISEKERKLIDECGENPLASIKSIEDNLVGEWNLVGYGCGFCVPHTAPQIKVKFSANGRGLLVSNQEDEQAEVEFSWRIDEAAKSQGLILQNRLITEPFDYRLNAAEFCNRYMTYDHTPVDGHMLLYQKR